MDSRLDFALSGLRRGWPALLLAAAITLLTWPGALHLPAPGYDPSWMVGLNLAAERGLDFGSQIDFTYGPLGFLENPLVINGWLATLGGMYSLAARFALALALLWALRRSFPLAIAFVIALLVATLIVDDELVAVAFVAGAAWIARPPAPSQRSLPLAAAGAVCALALLAKVSAGLIVLALVSVAVVGAPGRRGRDAATFGGALLAGVLGIWLLSGQSAGDIADYARHSSELVTGYSTAMALEYPAVAWDRAATIAAALAAAAATWLGTGGWDPGRRLAAFALVAVLVFGAYKTGFVRHDPGHMQLAFAALCLPWLAFEWGRRTRWLALAAIAAIAALYVPISDRDVDEVANPFDRLDLTFDYYEALLIPGVRDDARDGSYADLRAHYALEPRTLRAIGSEPVHVDPWETSLVWAYGLDWEPLPVFQSYAAYTPELDELNAAALESADGPARILRHPQAEDSPVANRYDTSVDNRYAPWEAPETSLAMLCNFEALTTTTGYQVLGRVPDRCGEPRPIGSVQAGYDEPIEVPRPSRGHVVVATVEGVGPSRAERLRAVAYRGLQRGVTFEGERTYRIVPATADGAPLIVNSSPGVDFPAPFGLAPDTRTIMFHIEPGFGDSSVLDVEFSSLPVAPAPGGGASESGGPAQARGNL